MRIEGDALDRCEIVAYDERTSDQDEALSADEKQGLLCSFVR